MPHYRRAAPRRAATRSRHCRGALEDVSLLIRHAETYVLWAKFIAKFEKAGQSRHDTKFRDENAQPQLHYQAA